MALYATKCDNINLLVSYICFVSERCLVVENVVVVVGVCGCVYCGCVGDPVPLVAGPPSLPLPAGYGQDRSYPGWGQGHLTVRFIHEGNVNFR